MSQRMEHRTITANQERTEYLATCNEIVEIELVLGFLDQAIAKSLKTAEPLAVLSNNNVRVAQYASNAFWQLLDLYREASNRRLNLCAARDYCLAVWESASAEHATADTYVSTPLNNR